MKSLRVVLVLKPLFGLRGQKSYTVKLPSNSSTGYSWTRKERCCPSIIDDSHCYKQYQGPPGTGGEDIWTFTAIGKGAEIARLVYARENAPEDIQDELDLHFTVR